MVEAAAFYTREEVMLRGEARRGQSPCQRHSSDDMETRKNRGYMLTDRRSRSSEGRLPFRDALAVLDGACGRREWLEVEFGLYGALRGNIAVEIACMYVWMEEEASLLGN
jgi:hypothetical protein